jgi:hypothetical protein
MRTRRHVGGYVGQCKVELARRSVAAGFLACAIRSQVPVHLVQEQQGFVNRLTVKVC